MKSTYDQEAEEFRVPLDREGAAVLVSGDLGALERELDWLAATCRYDGPFDEEEDVKQNPVL